VFVLYNIVMTCTVTNESEQYEIIFTWTFNKNSWHIIQILNHKLWIIYQLYHYTLQLYMRLYNWKYWYINPLWDENIILPCYFTAIWESKEQ
jgi:hypothetical protein